MAIRACASICLTAIGLLAHDLYLMPKPFYGKAGTPITVAFHNGDDFPEPDRPPRVENVIAQALAKETKVPFQNLRVDGKRLLAEVTLPHSGTALLTAQTKPTLIELEPLKFAEYLKHEGLNHVIQYRAKNNESNIPGRERYSKHVKSIVIADKPSAFYKQLAGFPIEIVPAADPHVLKSGSTFPIQVLFHGKPAPDLQIEMAWLTPERSATRKIAGRTDHDGKLEIPIVSRGVWKLHTVLMERCKEPAIADWESFWASLTFEVR